ncbi:uroporphyrinogen-III synthase [Glaciimonas sp. PAMC28666]|uniref:uroporphyrinogen-III synthase n=1 Tax=Glaciimonas sp. PAMC28666 TaxID=2807626 RepID=UPI001965C406|nr:uroporphyrinogen-III synthase [Glaciimonas sp. PAMC28666]QRX83186.1 uroporphyrinogen-III synthase [Glaciimonas sp. PAMC28666]
MNGLRPIVITRPLAQAKLLAQEITARGGEAIFFPLLEISPLNDDTELKATLAQLDRFTLVAFVSPNAIDAAFEYIQQWPAGVGIGIVGEGSRLALARHGIHAQNVPIYSPADSAKTDSEGLLKALDLPGLCGKRVLIVRGDGGRELLADTLRANGVEVWPLAAYRRQAPEMTPAVSTQLQHLLMSENDWIVTSSEALRNLMQMVSALKNVTQTDTNVVKMQHKNLLVPHARIADTAHALGFTTVTLTGSGDGRLLDALQFEL